MSMTACGSTCCPNGAEGEEWVELAGLSSVVHAHRRLLFTADFSALLVPLRSVVASGGGGGGLRIWLRGGVSMRQLSVSRECASGIGRQQGQGKQHRVVAEWYADACVGPGLVGSRCSSARRQVLFGSVCACAFLSPNA